MQRRIHAKGGIVLGDPVSPIAGLEARYAVNDRLTISAGYDRLEYRGFLAQTHSEVNLGVTYAASDMVEVFGKARRHTRDAGGTGISSTLFALAVTLYPTGPKNDLLDPQLYPRRAIRLLTGSWPFAPGRLHPGA